MLINYDLCFLTPKKKWIFCPTEKSRTIGKLFTQQIVEKWTPPEYFYHFKSGGHVAAIKAHCRSKYYCKADISNFFSSIRKNRIMRDLKRIRFHPKKAQKISEWSTVKSKDDPALTILPYGFVQSQIIASVCLDISSVGRYLKSLDTEFTVSVYVDDIIISGSNKKRLEAAYAGLLESFQQSNFKLNIDKSHHPTTKTQAFNIDISEHDIIIEPTRFSDFLKIMDSDNIKVTEAIIGYVSTVSKPQAEMLRQRNKEVY